ncbi:hypothetical protein [Acrocarpospora macrocephala]|uniref:hypothetical protein n=1 Tax=Acrocarpospora macrocephala TaxID=150177 RepID=UPI001C3F5518|nr:hypothetical protein [Acrocarpospora macrocephala]
MTRGTVELAGEHALAAADVEGALGAFRDRAQDAGVVMDVVVPSPAVLLCHVIILPDSGLDTSATSRSVG